MATILTFLPLLACAAVMGLMMKLMLRAGQGHASSAAPVADAGQQQELSELRGEAAGLRAEQVQR